MALYVFLYCVYHWHSNYWRNRSNIWFYSIISNKLRYVILFKKWFSNKCIFFLFVIFMLFETCINF